jgi:hypothetical protein
MHGLFYEVLLLISLLENILLECYFIFLQFLGRAVHVKRDSAATLPLSASSS